MEIKSIVGATCVCLSAVSLNVNASTIFNNIAGLENLEWLELAATENMMRIDVVNQLTIGGTFEGWRYATRSEVETLHDGLWGGDIEGWHASNYLGARHYFDNFGISSLYSSQNNGGYNSIGYAVWDTIFGATAECSLDATVSCRGNVGIRDVVYGATEDQGFFTDQYGLSTGNLNPFNNQNIVNNDIARTGLGSYLVRVSTVPIPSALWLFGTGLIGLIGVARRKKA